MATNIRVPRIVSNLAALALVEPSVFSPDVLVLGNDGGLFRLEAGTTGIDGVVRIASLREGYLWQKQWLRKSTIWMPARGMTSRTTNGAAAGTVELSTNKTMLVTLDFDKDTDEFAQFTVGLPNSWDGSTLTFRPVWTAGGGTAAETVTWSLQAKSVVDGGDLDAAWGTAVDVADALQVANYGHVGAESGALTVAGTLTWPSEQIFQVYRDTSADNLSVDAKLIGLWVLFDENKQTDA